MEIWWKYRQMCCFLRWISKNVPLLVFFLEIWWKSCRGEVLFKRTLTYTLTEKHF